MTNTNAVVPLRFSRAGSGNMIVRLPRAPGLLVHELTERPEQLLLDLGPTSTLELRALAAARHTTNTVAAVLTRLAVAAEQAMTRPRLLDHVVVTGGGSVPAGLLPVLSTYARRVTPPARANELPPGPKTDVDLVIATTSEALDLERCAEWSARNVPMLPVVARGDTVVIGPMLTPQHSPCAHCLELHRIDRDPRRRDLLLSPDPGLHDLDQLDLDPAQTAMAIGLVSTLIRCVCHGVPIPPALSLTVNMPYPQVGHHEWTPHPRCPCQRTSTD